MGSSAPWTPGIDLLPPTAFAFCPSAVTLSHYLASRGPHAPPRMHPFPKNGPIYASPFLPPGLPLPPPPPHHLHFHSAFPRPGQSAPILPASEEEQVSSSDTALKGASEEEPGGIAEGNGCLYPVPSTPHLPPEAPLLQEPTTQLDGVYELAAKLLFLSVKWARSIPSFLQLPFADQAILLEEAWSELFVLSAAQWSLPIDEATLVAGATASAARHSILSHDARRLRETVTRFNSLRVDHTEYACLKALVLFKPVFGQLLRFGLCSDGGAAGVDAFFGTDTRGLRNAKEVESLQEQTHIMLLEYCNGIHEAGASQPTGQSVRLGRLLLLLPSVGSVSRRSLEELFFRKTVGDVPIERLLGDMFQSS
ncbi:hypothetical protein J437_LFUL005584 [Ladona fulva]|uniref:NR LBD domain-containing protein n=1 Tax=Ladona fulva TaxID=123851 RepID=A0A8K0NVZ1_LADFU|nr:hypothetical protein J437_LFUL005584 [Ladona fulva]